MQLDTGENGSGAVERLFFILSAHFESQLVRLPTLATPLAWHRAVDTSLPAGEDFSDAGAEIRLDPAAHYIANPRSTIVLLAQ